jgi:hypothetical protein
MTCVQMYRVSVFAMAGPWCAWQSVVLSKRLSKVAAFAAGLSAMISLCLVFHVGFMCVWRKRLGCVGGKHRPEHWAATEKPLAAAVHPSRNTAAPRKEGWKEGISAVFLPLQHL